MIAMPLTILSHRRPQKLKGRVKELAGDERAFGAQALPLTAASLDHISKETDRCKRIAKSFHPDPKKCSV